MLRDPLELVSRQPHFPLEDLTQKNALYMDVVLANHSELELLHKIAEKLYPIFIGTHRPIVIASKNAFYDTSRVVHIDFGVRTFEAITAQVRAILPTPDFTALHSNITGIVNPLAVDAVVDYFDKSSATFLAELPRTAEVVAECAERYRMDKSCAVLGAAVARQFELDNVVSPK